MKYLGGGSVIYGADGIPIVEFPIIDEGVRRSQLMTEDFIKVVFNSDEFLPIGLGAYLVFENEVFVLTEEQLPKPGAYWKYELQFDAEYMTLKNVMFLFNNEAEWSLTTTPNIFLNMILYALNTKLGVNTWVLGVCFPSEGVVLSFNGSSALDALTDLAKACDSEWWFDGHTLNLTKCQFGVPLVLTAGANVASVEIGKSNADENFNRLYAFGSSRNIPSDYRSSEDGGIAIAEYNRRLKLPFGTYFIDARPDMLPDEIIPAVKMFESVYPRMTCTIIRVQAVGYIDRNSISFIRYFVKQTEFPWSDTYKLDGQTPKLTFQSGNLGGRTFEVNASESLSTSNAFSLFKSIALEKWIAKILEWENIHSMDKPQTFSAWLTARASLLVANGKVYHNNPSWGGTASDFFNEMFDYWAGVAGLVWNDSNPSTTMFNYTTSDGAFDNVSRIAFASWKSMLTACAVSDWNHAYSWSWDNAYAGYDIMCGLSEAAHTDIYSSGGWFEVINTFSSIYIPNDILKPEIGDTFILFNYNISAVNSVFIPTAELELKTVAEDYVLESIRKRNTYTIVPNIVQFANDDTSFKVGQNVMLYEVRIYGGSVASRVYSIERKLVNKYDCTFVVADNSKYSRLGKIEESVSALESVSVGGGGSSSGPYLIKMLDATPPTDGNAFSAARARLEMINYFSIPRNLNGNMVGLSKVANSDSVVLSIKLEEATVDTINDGHVAILTNVNGELHGEAYWNE